MKKMIKMNKELHEAVIRQLDSFKEKFGREAGPDDPLFFVPDYDVPTPLTEAKVKRELREAACKAGRTAQDSGVPIHRSSLKNVIWTRLVLLD